MRALLLHGIQCKRCIRSAFFIRGVPTGLYAPGAHAGRPARYEKANFITAWLCQQVIVVRSARSLLHLHPDQVALIEFPVLA